MRRRKGLEARINNSEVFEVFVREVKDNAIFLLDERGKVISWNEGAERVKGYTAEEVIGKHFSIFFTKEDVKKGEPERELEIAKKKGRYEGEGIRVRKDGSKFFANVVVIPVYDEGKLMGFIEVVRDISESRRFENRRQRVERALKVLNKTIQTIINAQNEKELLRGVCRAIVDEGYIYAWIGYATDDKTVKPITKAWMDDYANIIKTTWSEGETGKGLTDTAIQERKVVIAKKIAKKASSQPRKYKVMRRDYVSSIALPLLYRDDVFGTLSVYATEKDAFDRKEVKLLQEVAKNLAFAIAMLRSKKREEKIHEVMDSLWKLVTSEVDYRDLLNDALNEIIKITDSKYGFFGTITEDGGKLVMHACSKDLMGECKIPTQTHEFLIDEVGIWTNAVREKRAVMINDYVSLPFKKLPEGHLSLTRLLVVPVVAKGRVVSLVAVANKDENYTNDDAEMLRFFMTNIQGVLDKKRTEETYKTLIENTGTAMLIIDSETKIKFANEEVEKLYRVT